MIQPKIIKGGSWASPPKGNPLQGEKYFRCACKSWHKAKGNLDTISFRIVKKCLPIQKY